MIYTLTLNPTLDVTMECDQPLGSVTVSKKETWQLGGSGILVSLTLKELQMDSTMLGFVGGFIGEEIERKIKGLGMKTDFIHLHEGVSGSNVRIKGVREATYKAADPIVGSDEIKELFDRLINLQANDVLVLGGNILATMPDNLYETVLKVVSKKAIDCVVDANEEIFNNALQYHPFLVKGSVEELGDALQCRLHNNEEIIEAACKFQAAGARNVLITRGLDGALLVSETKEILHCPSPTGFYEEHESRKELLVAAFLAGYLKTKNYESALKLGVATAFGTHDGGRIASYEEIKTIYEALL